MAARRRRRILSAMKQWMLILLSAIYLYALPALARQDDPRLDKLFTDLHGAKNPAEARTLEHAIWSIWLESGSDTVDLLVRGGTFAMQRGDLAKADTLFDAVIQLAPDFAEGWNKRATLRFLQGDYVGSKGDVERTLSLEPRHFGALLGLAQIYDKLNNEVGELNALRRALAIDPQTPDLADRIKELTIKVEGRPI